MTYQHAASITVSGHTIPMQCFADAYSVRDRACPDLVAVQPPVPVADWPINPEQLRQLAQAKLDSFGLTAPTQKDAQWALELMSHSNTHYFRRALTTDQAEADQAKGRREYLRGEIS